MQVLMRQARWLHTRQQPLVATLLVLTMLAASLGIPVVMEPERDTSSPYPCMHHRCGCASADACWHGCCCLTLAQKLAWANKNGVTPPDYVLAQVETPKSSGGSCCKHDELASAACDDRDALPSPAVKESEESGLTVGLVLVNDFRRCQGLSSLWLTLSHALPPRLETSAPKHHPVPCAWLRVTSQSAESLALSPPTPPPRSVCSA